MWKWEWICWFVNLISRTPAQRVRRYRRLIERLSREADLDDGWWHVFRDYPKNPVASTVSLPGTSSPIHGTSSPDRPNEQTAIVVQGPLIERDDQTLQTLGLYRRTMPQSVLIYSTWNDLESEQRRRIEALGVKVVTSELPDHCGPHNLNLQIVSTRRGLEEAQRLGCTHAMKTRADSRIHMCDADRFCRDLLKQFPVNTTAQRERLLVVDFATRLYVPYHPSDILMFGATQDLLSYWSLELCGPEMTFEVCENFDDMLQQATPEVVLGRNYLQRTGMQLSDSIDQWWQILADRFVVIDRDMIDLFWPKYNYNVDQRLGMKWDTGNMALCHFAQWMQIHSRGVAPSITLDQLRCQKVHDSLPEYAKQNAA